MKSTLTLVFPCDTTISLKKELAMQILRALGYLLAIVLLSALFVLLIPLVIVGESLNFISLKVLRLIKFKVKKRVVLGEPV